MPKPTTITLPGSDGANHALTEFAGAPAIVYFYPKDDTPGCTTEACEFRDAITGLATASVPVIGVSPDPVKSHLKFIAKYSLPFLLLADEQHQLAESFGVWTEKSMYGKTYMGIERSTFLLDAKGAIAQEWRKVKVAGHVAEVVAAALALNKK